MLSTVNFQRGQTPLIYMAVKDAESNDPIGKTSVTEITYTLCKETTSGLVAITGHDNVTVALTNYFNGLQTSDALCTLTGGYNFRLSPDTTTVDFFSDAGLYRLTIRFEFTDRNPYSESIQFIVL